jgi:hypothetical protein
MAITITITHQGGLLYRWARTDHHCFRRDRGIPSPNPDPDPNPNPSFNPNPNPNLNLGGLTHPCAAPPTVPSSARQTLMYIIYVVYSYYLQCSWKFSLGLHHSSLIFTSSRFFSSLHFLFSSHALTICTCTGRRHSL